MDLHALARRQHLAAFGSFSLFQVWNIWRRRRWWRTEKNLHDPLSAQYRRRAVRKRCEHQDAAMAQHTSPPVIRILHAPKVRSSDARNSVVLGETLIHECIVCIEQLEHASILANEVIEEQLRFASHRIGQIFVEIGIKI